MDTPFEKALEKLEHIVSQLEAGNLTLEESLKLFEEGMTLSRHCRQKLDEAEKKVEKIVKELGPRETESLDIEDGEAADDAPPLLF
jgi:exodeoxyribonuclease VII small subunit